MKLQTATINLEKAPITKILKPGESFNFKNIGVGFCQICLQATSVIDVNTNPQIKVSGYGFTYVAYDTIYSVVSENVPVNNQPIITQNFFCDDVVITNILPADVTITINSPRTRVRAAIVGPISIDTNIILGKSTVAFNTAAGNFGAGNTYNLFGTLNFFGAPLATNARVAQPLFAFRFDNNAGNAPYTFVQNVPYELNSIVSSVLVYMSNQDGLPGDIYTLAVLQQGSGY
jgi:hypothetical protein